MAGLAELTHPKGKDGKRRLVALAALAVVAVLFLRHQSAQGAATGIIGSADPTAADPSSSGDSGGSGSGTDPAGDTSAIAAALEGLGSGLTDVQTQLSQNAADQQSMFEELAQAQQALNDLFSTPAADPNADFTTADPNADNSVIDAHNRSIADWQAAQNALGRGGHRSVTTTSLPTLSGHLPSVPVVHRSLLPPITPRSVQQAVRSVNPATVSPQRVQQAVAHVNPAAVNGATLRASLAQIRLPSGPIRVHL